MKNLNIVELALTAEKHVVAIKDLCVYPKMQMRVEMQQQTINEYAEDIDHILSEEPIEVVVVDSNGYKTWYVVDGFHRYHAAMLAGKEEVPILLMEGTYEQALQYAMSVNWKNGMRPKKEDAARSIDILMQTAPDFGFDSKQVSKWLKSFGIPASTSNPHTKTLRDAIDVKRGAKILELKAEGLSNVQIAKEVGCTDKTVASHLEKATSENERDVETPSMQSEEVTPIATPEVADSAPEADDFDLPFDEDELDTTPALNPADAFQKALKEHEDERQETTRQQDSSVSASVILAKENVTTDVTDRIKQLLRDSGIYEDHTKAEVNAALFAISQGN